MALRTRLIPSVATVDGGITEICTSLCTHSKERENGCTILLHNHHLLMQTIFILFGLLRILIFVDFNIDFELYSSYILSYLNNRIIRLHVILNNRV